jgi:hypothetical protein
LDSPFAGEEGEGTYLVAADQEYATGAACDRVREELSLLVQRSEQSENEVMQSTDNSTPAHFGALGLCGSHGRPRSRRSCAKLPKTKNRAQARARLFDYIETFYNPELLHSALGYFFPLACPK